MDSNRRAGAHAAASEMKRVPTAASVGSECARYKSLMMNSWHLCLLHTGDACGRPPWTRTDGPTALSAAEFDASSSSRDMCSAVNAHRTHLQHVWLGSWSAICASWSPQRRRETNGDGWAAAKVAVTARPFLSRRSALSSSYFELHSPTVP
jgi:hypothetical protein